MTEVDVSGVTKIGVTGAATDGVTYYFFLQKNWRPFLVIILCKVMTFLAIVSSQTFTPSQLRHRLSSVLTKFSHIFFHSGVTPGWCHPEGPSAPLPPVAPLVDVCRRLHGHGVNRRVKPRKRQVKSWGGDLVDFQVVFLVPSQVASDSQV